jgi:hypothetical protein
MLVSFKVHSRHDLQIGINYANTPNSLLGCVNDARNVRRFLVKYHGFSGSDIVLLTDDHEDARSRPTRQNILDAMRWLVRDACPNDSLFFHCELIAFTLTSIFTCCWITGASLCGA